MAQSTEILPNGLQLLQDDRFFKLGQDSVLLSAFAKPRRNAKLLDLRTAAQALWRCSYGGPTSRSPDWNCRTARSTCSGSPSQQTSWKT